MAKPSRLDGSCATLSAKALTMRSISAWVTAGVLLALLGASGLHTKAMGWPKSR